VKEMTLKTIKRHLQESMARIKKLDTEGDFDKEIKKAKALGYLASVSTMVFKETPKNTNEMNQQAINNWLEATSGDPEPDLWKDEGDGNETYIS
jgi:hypothetical protein